MLTCHCTLEGIGLPVATAVKEVVPPAVTVTFAGPVVIGA